MAADRIDKKRMNKAKNTIPLLLLLILLPLWTWGQVTITYPQTRMVFQRNKSNQAQIRVGGFYSVPVSRVEARAVPIQGGTGTDWTVIQNNPQGGTFAGTMTLSGGWYRLEVRGLQGEQFINGQGVDRMGVGEVFIIAGQSNAQGFFAYGAQRANDDRVNAVNYSSGPNDPSSEPPYPTFTHLEAEMYVAPRGESAWCWGRLGDLLASRLNVPILFFNAAWTATSVINWRVSAEGGQAVGEFTPSYLFPLGQPYGNLRNALQYYAHSLGVRAVLWHQGETDSFKNRSTDEYAGNLQTLIQISRNQSGKNISWVVAKASYDDVRKSNGAILAGQDKVIQTVPNVFAGPNTDVIQIPRRTAQRPDDNIHFQDAGLIELANAWSNSLNDQFFQNSSPHTPAIGPTVTVSCAGTNTVTLAVNGASGDTRWNNGAGGASLTTGSGRFFARIRDGQGNTVFTVPYEVTARPTIAASGSTTLCEGNAITLTSSYNELTNWSPTNTTGRTISVSTAGTYTARYRDVSGCDFVSDPVNVTVNPLPPTPTAKALEPTRFCDRNTTTLEATEGLIYNWSDGQKARQIKVGRSGSYFLTVTDQNGCTSKESNRIDVQVDPLPPRPALTASGPTTFCADQNVTLTSTPENSYIWSNGATNRSITINQAGDYRVQTRNTFGCLSDPSDIVNVKVNPLPPAPAVSASGPTTFCDGNRVTLTASSSLPVLWTTNETGPTIVATRSGNYSARVRDQNSCLSPLSPPVVVDVKPVPSVPTVRQVGTYTLEAQGPLAGDYYQWRRDSLTLPARDITIKAAQSGSYRAQAFLVYDNGLTCSSVVSAPFLYVVLLDNQGVSIYPNPSTDKKITVETLEDLKDARVTVYTLTGQEVYSTQVAVFNERQFVDLTTIPAGQYILHVRSGDFSVGKRVLIGL